MCNKSNGLDLNFKKKLTDIFQSQCELGFVKHSEHTQSQDTSACDQRLRILSNNPKTMHKHLP